MKDCGRNAAVYEVEQREVREAERIERLEKLVRGGLCLTEARLNFGIGGKLLRVAEPRYVVDLRIDQPCEELADAGDRPQQLDVGIGLGHRPDRCFRLFDPHVDVADEGETTIDLDAVDLRDVNLSQLDAAGLAEQVTEASSAVPSAPDSGRTP
jgi:hypothetical protein